MKPETIKQWFTAVELAELALPGLPTTKRKVNEKAAADRWALACDDKGAPLARQRAGRGGGFEYHFSLLPIAARAALVKRGYQLDAVAVLPSAHTTAWQAYERLPTTAKAEAEARAAVIARVEALEGIGLNRTAAIAAAASEAKKSTATVWEWLRLVDGVAAVDRLPFLAPQRSGGGRKADIDPELWTIILSDWLRPEKPTLTSVYRRAQDVAEVRGLTLPTYRTISRMIDQLDPRLVVSKRDGQESLRQMLPATKRSVAHLHALEMVNVDGHKFDVFVKLDTGEIVRPMLVGIQDLYSRKLVGWRLGASETAHLTRLAFADVFRNYGIPKACYFDNGRAFASKWITGGAKSRFRFKIKEEEQTGLLTSLGIQIHWTLPYRGQSKPIERTWRMLSDAVAKHPVCAGAYTGNKPDAKPENYGSKAVPFDVFRQLVDHEIARLNAQTGRQTEMANGRSVDDVFNESYAVSPIGKATEEQLRLALLMGEQVATDRKDGSIALAGNRYWAEQLSAVAGKRVIIRFDPDNLHQELHVYSHDGRYLCAAQLWEAVGFDNHAAAKARAKQEAGLRRQARELEKAEALLSADQVAAIQPDFTDTAPLPQPGAVRPHRHRGQTAAALKLASQPSEMPVSDRNLDRFADAVSRLRLVE